MSIVKRSISVTDEQHSWIKAQIERGTYGNESEVYRDLIRKEQERQDKIAHLQKLIIEGEESGMSDKTARQVFAEIKQRIHEQNDQL